MDVSVVQLSLEDISIHALREEGDAAQLPTAAGQGNFYPRPPRGGRRGGKVRQRRRRDFYPRPPRGGRPRKTWISCVRTYFYPRPPRGGRRASSAPTDPPAHISIHALREEGDDFSRIFGDFDGYFYPRPPRGGRPKQQRHSKKPLKFLSTPSARRATISTMHLQTSYGVFLSTPSARRATRHCTSAKLQNVISIHALREEGDSRAARRARTSTRYFYPRPPRGGRRVNVNGFTHILVLFLSTPSARRATVSAERPKLVKRFLSTPSARRATPERKTDTVPSRFLSTPSARRATDWHT